MLRPAILGTNTADGIGRAPRGINDGKGFVLISDLGEVFPSGFLPVSAGNVRKQSLAELYRHSPLFVSLRDRKNLKGKCGICEFREVCGGSRARAYALTGDVFAEEPCCVWQAKISIAEPAKIRVQRASRALKALEASCRSGRSMVRVVPWAFFHHTETTKADW